MDINIQLQLCMNINNPGLDRQQEASKKDDPKFFKPDQKTQALNSIMSNIQRKQEQILQMLNKYKNMLPEQEIDNHNIPVQQKQLNKDVSKSRKINEKFNMYEGSLIVKNVKDRRSSSKVQPANKQESRAFSNSRTISYNSQSQRVRNKDKYQQQGFKLPLIEKPKEPYQIHYEKVQKAYNERIKELYEMVNKKNSEKEDYLIKLRNGNVKIKQRKRRSNNSNHKNQVNATSEKQIQDQSEENIFDARINEPSHLLSKDQITSPISYYPYQQQDQSRSSQVKKASRSVVLKGQDSEEQQPTSVPVSYYSRTFNQALNEQCKQEINYLYFSKSDQHNSNKEWAQEIIKMFQKHDSQLVKLHKGMRFLQNFDEGYFTSSIYTNGT